MPDVKPSTLTAMGSPSPSEILKGNKALCHLCKTREIDMALLDNTDRHICGSCWADQFSEWFGDAAV